MLGVQELIFLAIMFLWIAPTVILVAIAHNKGRTPPTPERAPAARGARGWMPRR